MRPLLLLAFAALFASAASAQRYGTSPPRYGVGLDAYTALTSQDVVPGAFALGLRGRVALPVNADISIAGDLGLAAHLFDGTNNARYVLNPQASVIVTLPQGDQARYLLGGLGAFVPFSGGGGGPALHLGYGLAFPLTETSVFAEVNPSFVVGERESTVVLSIRGGVIF